jgi:monovalent cation/hydrogen antiporter
VAQFELIIALLLAGVLLASIARRLKMPYPVLLAGLGAVLAFAPNLPDLTLDPQLTLALFVAPVLLDAAYDVSLRDLKDNWRPVASLALIAVGLTVVSVMSYNTVIRWKNRHFGVSLPQRVSPPTLQGGIMVSWCGMRGIVTLAAALALPDTFPYRDILLFTAFSVVLGTLIIQGLTVRPLMMALSFADDRIVEEEVRLARIEIARAALSILDKEKATDATAVIRREYEARQEKGPDRELVSGNATSELAATQSRAIAAERLALAGLRSRGDIGDDAFHYLEEELDWAEVYAQRAAYGQQVS